MILAMVNPANSYDDVPYPGYVHAQTHPDRMAVPATLFGMQPVPVDRCRVLELGCGSGANLIPMACRSPESQFLGIDLSARQIDQGQVTVDTIGLDNIELRAQSILDFPIDAGSFDYIIVHGVFSWVPAEVREAILQICQRHLSPQGLALISYNTFPGWHQRRMIRDMMRYHAGGFESAEQSVQQAKAFLSFMTKAVPDGSAYGRALREEAASLSDANASYIFHEQLEEINEPMYFHQFAQQAGEHQLQYVSEIELSNLQLQRYPQQVADALQGMDVIQREQYLDFMTRRTFRQTLLCHGGVTLDREIDAQRLMSLRIASPAAKSVDVQAIERGEAMELATPDGASVRIGHRITIAAMLHLANVWPGSIDFDSLLTAARASLSADTVVLQNSAEYESDRLALANHLLQSHMAGIVGLQSIAETFVTQVSDTPKVCPLARYQALQEQDVATRRHQLIPLDPLTRNLLQQLDGATSQQVLLDRMVAFVLESDIVLQHQGSAVTERSEINAILQEKMLPNLKRLAEFGLLVG